MNKPLTDVRVVELATMIAAPAATAMLADLGADVTKVELLTGDPTRAFTPPSRPDAAAPPFLVNNAGKRSIAVDLRSPDGAEIVRRLIHSADVVVDNFRAGALERLGVSPEAICAEHPALIWATISGFGARGPDSGRRAVDQIVQAEAGIVAMTGPPDGLGFKTGFQAVDHAAAVVVVARVLAALIQRAQTGQGTRMVQSLFEAALWLQATSFTEYLLSGDVPRRSGNASQLSTPSDAVRTRDGGIMVVAYLEPHWRLLCETLGRMDLLADPRFEGRLNRLRHRTELLAELESTTAEYTTDELFRRLETAGVMAGRIQDYAQIAASAEVADNDIVVDVVDDRGRSCRAMRTPFHSPATDGSHKRVPGLGEHGDEVLRAAGYSEAEIAALVEAGVVVRQPQAQRHADQMTS